MKAGLMESCVGLVRWDHDISRGAWGVVVGGGGGLRPYETLGNRLTTPARKNEKKKLV